jgi:hypothetical protein
VDLRSRGVDCPSRFYSIKIDRIASNQSYHGSLSLFDLPQRCRQQLTPVDLRGEVLGCIDALEGLS